MKITVKKKPLKVLDFDCETRPLSWISSDFVSKEITAIAAGFIGEKRVNCWLLGESTTTEMLDEFLDMYNDADIVTGHYIKKYDLPLINSALLENGYTPLKPKLAQDTCEDLVKRHGISKSQESLSAMFGLQFPKISMNQSDWRDANRLTDSGLAKTRKRVVGDVKQHMEMRSKLLEMNMLKAPKMWNP